MVKQAAGLVVAVMVVAAAADAIPRDGSDLTVHEWGTFTTVAGEDGRAVPWRPLDGPVDLPCFVERAELGPKYAFVTTVRMETPVIYFYAPRPVTVDVSVGFTKGLMTEFFPRPTSIPERGTTPARYAMSRLQWKDVKVLPGSTADFPYEDAPNHYYAARAADASPIDVSGQKEGFLFYRGAGGFTLPLRASVSGSREIQITNEGADPIPSLMVFENRGGRVGFRIHRLLSDKTAVVPPALNGDIAAVRASLVAMLTAEGLFLKEAEAMVETWSTTWFEEGTRVFYIVPKPLIERALPLDVRPGPLAIDRVFVGRLEIAAPWLLENLQDAFARFDRDKLAAHGRFLEPFSQRLLNQPLAPAEKDRIVSALAATAQEFRGGAADPCETTTGYESVPSPKPGTEASPG